MTTPPGLDTLPHMDRELPEWHLLAACRDSDLDFYDLTVDNWHRCVQMCNDCPVQQECLEASIYPRLEGMGIWGGYRPEPRKAIRRREQDRRRAERQQAERELAARG